MILWEIIDLWRTSLERLAVQHRHETNIRLFRPFSWSTKCSRESNR